MLNLGLQEWLIVLAIALIVRGPEMYRQPQLNSPIQVGGHAAQEGRLDLLPRAARRNCPTKPALDDRDERLGFPPLAIGLTGKAQVQLAAIGAGCHPTRWPSHNRRNAALDTQVFSPPAVVCRRIVTAIGYF